MGFDVHGLNNSLDELAYYEGRAMARSSRSNTNPYELKDRRAKHWANGYASIANEARQAAIRAALPEGPTILLS